MFNQRESLPVTVDLTTTIVVREYLDELFHMGGTGVRFDGAEDLWADIVLYAQAAGYPEEYLKAGTLWQMVSSVN